MYVKSLNILLAEDNPDHAELIVDALKQFNIGNHVFHVKNGEEVLGFLDQKNGGDRVPDLILLDLKMPRLDGAETLAHIKAMAPHKRTPVIMLSTSGMNDDVEKCYALGANSYVTKPLKFNEFTQKIRELNLYWVLTSEIPGPNMPTSEHRY